MSLDPYKTTTPEDIPELEKWIRDVSGISDLFVVSNEMPYEGDSVACVYPKFDNNKEYSALIHINSSYLFWTRQSILYYRVYLMHEAGHILNCRLDHSIGTQEFMAHFWAIKKASLSGMERELDLLRFGVRQWYREGLGDKNHRPFYRIYKFLRRKGAM